MFKKKFHNSIDKGRYGYLFIVPFFIVFAVFGLYPIVYTFILSFQKWDGLAKMTPLGWKNYARLLTDDVFYLSIWNTIRIWIFNFVPQMLTALLLSALFTFNRIRGMKFFRAAYYLPNLITAASVGLLFNLLFDGNKSVANYILQALHVKGAPFSFFNSGAFTSGMTSYIQWWMWFGYTTVIVMAGITTIEGSVYDAAMVDGATKAQTFTKITLPLIRPTLIYMTITSIIGGMQLFDVPTTLTNGTGDPNKSVLTTSMYLYNQGFKNFNYGYASTMSVGLQFLVCLLSALCRVRRVLTMTNTVTNQKSQTSYKAQKIISNVIIYAFLIFLLLLSIVPFYLVVVNATHSSFDIVTKLNLLPGKNTLENYTTMQSRQHLARIPEQPLCSSTVYFLYGLFRRIYMLYI